MMKKLLEIKNVSYVYKSRNSIFNTAKEHRVFSNISFDLHENEIVGVYGKNGSGKSTLLKIIANILKPTDGYIINHNAKVCLLNLSVGFNPKLNGYDNAILLGMLQGVTKKKMLNIIRDIHDFSELGKWFYEPIYKYSAGMKTRLSFSTSIFIDTDILLLDEILTVGDEVFREKTSVFMKETSQRISIILVTHNKAKLSKLTSNIIEI